MLPTITFFLETAASVIALAGSCLLLAEAWRRKSRLYLWPGLTLLVSSVNISFVYLAQIVANFGQLGLAAAFFKALFVGLLLVLFLAWLYLAEYFSLPRAGLFWPTLVLGLLAAAFGWDIIRHGLALAYYGRLVAPVLDLTAVINLTVYSLVILGIIAVVTLDRIKRGLSPGQWKSLRLLFVSLLCGFGVVASIILFAATQSLACYFLIWLFIFLIILSHFLGAYLPLDSPFLDHPLDFFRSRIIFKLVFLYTFLMITAIALTTILSLDRNERLLVRGLAGPDLARLLEANYMIFALLGVLVSFVAGLILAWDLTRPLKRILGGVEHIKSGDLDHRIEVEGFDEIDQLAGAFNEMTADLRAARAKIEDWNHELEAQVKERTQKLEQAQAQLVQAAKLAAMGELVSGLTHDINNPLTSIVMYTDLLQRKASEVDPQTAEILGELKKLASHLLGVSRNFLSFIRKTEPELKPTRLAEVVANTAVLVHQPLMKKNIELVTDLPAGLPQVLADASQLQQVFVNLFTNAIHALPQNGRLVVSARQVQSGQAVEIEVADNGSGIAAADLPRIFEPFFTTRPLEQGTGLGLSICQGIIKKHRGEIRVQSRLGQGTTFTMILPAA